MEICILGAIYGVFTQLYWPHTLHHEAEYGREEGNGSASKFVQCFPDGCLAGMLSPGGCHPAIQVPNGSLGRGIPHSARARPKMFNSTLYTRLGFGTGFTNQSGKPIINNNRRLFSKHLAQLVILKTDLNQFIGMVPKFWVLFGSTFCPLFVLKRDFGSSKRWPMVNYNFGHTFDHCGQACMGSLLTDGKILVSEGQLIGKTGYFENH